MRTPTLAFLPLISWFPAAHSAGHELPLFGTLPLFGKFSNPGEGWALCEQGQDDNSTPRWHWLILTNSQTGDVLSLAAHKPESGEPRQLIYLSDTAHEIF